MNNLPGTQALTLSTNPEEAGSLQLNASQDENAPPFQGSALLLSSTLRRVSEKDRD